MVCFSNISAYFAMVSVMFVLLTIGGGPVGLVLVFAATHKEMALLYASRRNQYGKQNVEFLHV